MTTNLPLTVKSLNLIHEILSGRYRKPDELSIDVHPGQVRSSPVKSNQLPASPKLAKQLLQWPGKEIRASVCSVINPHL
jgi:hypothetical protein